MKFYKCKACDSIMILNAPNACCIDGWQELATNTTDAAGEKHVPVIEAEVKKMGGFGAALEEKNRNEGIGIGREQRDREKIEVMLRKGLKPEEVANYGDYPLALVKEVESNMLSLA